MLRPLLIHGPRRAGKATTACAVAARTGRPFIDLRSSAASSDPTETDLGQLLRSTDPVAPVVALDSGALRERNARLAALDAAVVVSLAPAPSALAARTATPEARIIEELEARREIDTEAHARITTDGRTPEDIAADIEHIWRRDPLAVAVGEQSYCVDVGRSIIDATVPRLVADHSQLLLVSDDIVAGLYSQRLETALGAQRRTWVQIEHGEANKNLASLERIWEQAFASGIDRKSCLLALGGGVLSDVAGFAAATWMRGIRWVVLPTTLLSMVDASVGGKTAIDLREAKNAVGAFWQPKGVVSDIDFLATESRRRFVSALAEVVKTAIIGDPALFESMSSNPDAVLARDPDLLVDVVRRSIRVKARIVSADARESGLRAVLNLGHTLGHALEAHGQYERLSHGEAISLGLVAALELGARLRLTPVELLERTRRLLAALDLPYDLGSQPLAEASALVGHDKKKSGSRLMFTIARDLGRVESVPLELSEVQRLAREL